METSLLISSNCPLVPFRPVHEADCFMSALVALSLQSEQAKIIIIIFAGKSGHGFAF